MKIKHIICFLALLFTACATDPVAYLSPGSGPQTTWRIFVGNEHWYRGTQSRTRNSHLLEFVPEGQTVENWKEIITDAFIPGHFSTTTDFVRANLSDLRTVVDGFQSTIISDTGNEALYEWWHPDSGKWPAEHQISRVKYYPNGMLTLSYARKGPKMDDATRTKWIERISTAPLR